MCPAAHAGQQVGRTHLDNLEGWSHHTLDRGQPFGTLHPLVIARKEQGMDSSLWLGILVGFLAGGGGVWYFKVLTLQKSVLTMTGEYQRAEKGRRELEAKGRAY